VNTDNEPIVLPPAVPKLLRWLELQNLAPHAFALKNGIDPSNLSKIINGKQGAGLKLAVAIEEATGGAVPAADWRRP
jgi:hypothetical protein